MSVEPSSESPGLRDPKKVDGWRQAVVLGAAVLALLCGPFAALLVFALLRSLAPSAGALYTLLVLVVAVVVLVGFFTIPIWVYRRLIGRGSGVHSRSGGASSAQ